MFWWLPLELQKLKSVLGNNMTKNVSLIIRIVQIMWPTMYTTSLPFSLPEQQNHPSVAAAKSEVSYFLHKTIWTVQTDKIMELTTFRATSWNPVWKCRMEDQVPCWWICYKNSWDAKMFHKKMASTSKTSQLLIRTAFSCYSSQDKEAPWMTKLREA